MQEISKILDQKLYNNEPLLIKTIFSFLKCKACKKRLTGPGPYQTQLCLECIQNNHRVCDCCGDIENESWTYTCDKCLAVTSCMNCEVVCYCVKCQRSYCEKCQPVFVNFTGDCNMCGDCICSVWDRD